jgi:hypothetical protein
MASPKRKTKSSAKTAPARATRSSYKPGTKSAASTKPEKREAPASVNWAQPAAKLYQMPFNSEEVTEATRKAASNATEMWRTMWDPKGQQWNQMFANAPKFPGFDAANAGEKLKEFFASAPKFPGFDAGSAGEQMKKFFASAPKFPDFDGTAAAPLKQFSQESVSQFTRSASTAAHALKEAQEVSRENAETAVECGNLVVAVSKEIGAEIISHANRTFAQNLELSKQVMTCRTLNDMFDLSGRFIKTNLDSFFSESVHLSELLFRSATEISEPLNERISDTTERLSKVMSA